MAASKTDAKLLTCRQVAERYGVNVETVRRWVRKEIIAVVFVGPTRRIRITQAEADKHFKQARA